LVAGSGSTFSKLAFLVLLIIIAMLVAESIYQGYGGDFAAFYWSGWCVNNGQLQLLYDQPTVLLPRGTASASITFRGSSTYLPLPTSWRR